MQDIWRLKLSWDESLPDVVKENWYRFISELHLLSEIRVPRFVGVLPRHVYCLCGFCDASERGYAALVYLRVTDSDGQVKMHLLGAKTKLAPLHPMTIPRLELCAAVLLTRWLARIRNTLTTQLTISDTFVWTDSSIVLSWLTTKHVSFKIFVSNRVNKIQQLLPNCSWRHVNSIDNPADAASRGLLPSDLKLHSLYWQGPKFLYDNPSTWNTDFIHVQTDPLPEIKLTSLLATSPDLSSEWFDRFSSYLHMLRVTAWVRRFISGCRRKIPDSCMLSRTELDDALRVVVTHSQRCHFHILSDEISRKLPISSKHLARLSPFIDSQGIIRVGGRLRNTQLSENRKHPILLAKLSALSTLITRHWHLYTCHSGPRLMTSLISRQFWIISARRVIGKVIKQCTICVRLAAVGPQPMMADLPPGRVLPCRPFSKIGIDFACPLTMREQKLRKARDYKVYIAVYVCMTVKAVHLEIVSDLSSDTFLAALDRFVARRGIPSDIYSDCGTNFIGASKQLRQLFALPENQDKLSSHLPCSWHFNPPSAPHFGGLWEAAVRSMKTLLVRVMGSHTLTLEELLTITCRIEAILNSRPLTSMSCDPHDLKSLTPGHFLIGEPLLSIPNSNVLDKPSRLVTRWKLLHQSHQAFWKRWSNEYLNTLQARAKWVVNQIPVKEGDMVVIKDSQMPPLKWRLGRVVELLPGTDKVVRVVKLITKQGTIIRPVVKLVLLPTGISSQ